MVAGQGCICHRPEVRISHWVCHLGSCLEQRLWLFEFFRTWDDKGRGQGMLDNCQSACSTLHSWSVYHRKGMPNRQSRTAHLQGWCMPAQNSPTPNSWQTGFYFHFLNRLHNVRAYKTPKLFLFGQFLLKQLYQETDCKPESVIQQPQARSPYWERLVCEQKCIINFLSYFLWERCPKCSPLFCKDWMLHQEHCHWKWAFFWHLMRVLYRGTGHIHIQSKKAATHIDLLLAPEHLCSQPCALTIRLHKHQRAGLTQWQQPSFRCTIPVSTQKHK